MQTNQTYLNSQKLIISVGNFFYEPVASIRNSQFSNSAASRKNLFLLDALSSHSHYKPFILSYSRPPRSNLSFVYYKSKIARISRSLIYLSAAFSSSLFTSHFVSFLSILSLLFAITRKYKYHRAPIAIYYNINLAHLPLILCTKILGFRNVLQLEDLPTRFPLNNYISRLFIKSFYSRLFFSAWIVTSLYFLKHSAPSMPVYEYYGVIKREQCINKSHINSTSSSAREINFIFSGTLDADSGCILLYNSLLQLDKIYSNFEKIINIFITGAGTNHSLLSQITMTNPNINVITCGVLEDSSLANLLDSCHYGFSLKLLKGEYGITTFPSKLFTYLNHSVMPISTRLPQVVNCFSDLIFYTDENSKSLSSLIISLVQDAAYYEDRVRRLSLINSIYEEASVIPSLQEFLDFYA